MATLVTLVDGTIPVAADFNTNFTNLNTETRAVNRGGTGATTLTDGGVLLGNGTDAITATAVGTANQVLRIPGAGGDPSFGAVDLAQSAAITGTLGIGNGGLGLTSGTSGGVLAFTGASTLASSAALTANGVVLGGGAGAAPTSTTAGTANQVFRVPGAGGAPAFGAVDLAQSAAVTGTLARANGGTGAASATTDGQLLIGNTATGNWSVATLTQGANITITNGGGSITIAGSASVSAATQAEMEAASDTTVYASPGRTHFHPGVAKAWCSFDVSGAIQGSARNVSSITDTGTGQWTVNLTTGFSATDNDTKAQLATSRLDSGASIVMTASAQSTCEIQARNTSGTLTDPTDLQYVAFGDFA